MIRTAAAILALALPCAWSQQAISVRAGLIHHLEGKATLDGAPFQMERSKFLTIKDGSTFSTENGMAEVLLAPGIFMRLGKASSMKMVSGLLTDTQIELAKGSALVEVLEIGKENRIEMRVADSASMPTKPGLYFFDADTGNVRVFDGKMEVKVEGQTLDLGRGKQLFAGKELTASKFSTKDTNSLYDWSKTRSAMVAYANISASRTLRTSGYRVSNSMWAWYPAFGLVTYLPRSGYVRSPFGWAWYNPSSIWQYYAGPGYQSGGGGGGGGFSASTGSWGGWGPSRGASGGGSYSGDGGFSRSSSVSSAPAASAPAASAPAPQASPGGGRGR